VASTSIAAAAGAEHATGGLPQFDFSWWAGEAVWTVAIFVVLLFLFTKVFVPRVGGTIDEREDRISGDIGAARKLRDEADAQAAAAAAETAQARGAAQKLALDAKAKAIAEAAAREAVEEAKLAETLAKADLRIAGMRDAAMANVREIAGTTAGLIVEKLTGTAATAQEVDQALTGRA
jgi:F-type H+-transporting ATPase subunit b